MLICGDAQNDVLYDRMQKVNAVNAVFGKILVFDSKLAQNLKIHSIFFFKFFRGVGSKFQIPPLRRVMFAVEYQHQPHFASEKSAEKP